MPERVSGFVNVPTNIWSDGAFAGLTMEAQAAWFWLRTSPRIARNVDSQFAREHGLDVADAKRILDELRALPEQYRSAFNRARRAPIRRADRIATFERDGWACIACGATESLSIDHVIPLAKGGANDASNYATLCRPCNSKKGASVP